MRFFWDLSPEQPHFKTVLYTLLQKVTCNLILLAVNSLQCSHFFYSFLNIFIAIMYNKQPKIFIFIYLAHPTEMLQTVLLALNKL
jgi:hypothetical protein